MKDKDSMKALFEDVVGQISATRLLEAAIKSQRIATAYLFSGPDGVGRKLTTLRFLEGLINNGCPNISLRKRLEHRNYPDLLWVEPTYLNQGNLITQSSIKKEEIKPRSLPQIRLEQIREVKRFLSKKPVASNLGMVVIEDIEKMNEAASNALLKTLEEPNHGLFILISERPESILKTISSRCQKITFNRLNINSIKKIFENQSKAISIDLSNFMEKKELLSISHGSPGAILKNLEYWESIPTDLWHRIKKIDLHNSIDSLSLAKDLSESLTSEQQIWLIIWLQQYLWSKENNLKAINQLEILQRQLKSFVNPRLAWEVTLLKINDN